MDASVVIAGVAAAVPLPCILSNLALSFACASASALDGAAGVVETDTDGDTISFGAVVGGAVVGAVVGAVAGAVITGGTFAVIVGAGVIEARGCATGTSRVGCNEESFGCKELASFVVVFDLVDARWLLCGFGGI